MLCPVSGRGADPLWVHTNIKECVFSDLEQLDLASLCDGVVRFLQDLPGPVLPTSLQSDMILAVQGESLAVTPRLVPCLVLTSSLCVSRCA